MLIKFSDSDSVSGIWNWNIPVSISRLLAAWLAAWAFSQMVSMSAS